MTVSSNHGLLLNRLEYVLLPIKVRRLLAAYENDVAACLSHPTSEWEKKISLSPSEKQWLSSNWPPKDKEMASALALLDTGKVVLISISEDRYPALLKQIPDHPNVVFAKGRLEQLSNSLTIGVVGTRHMTAYGEKVTQSLINGFTPDLVWVSGMAAGIDACAHRRALESGAPTIGILGCGIDQIYPSGNKALYGLMADSGLLISEFPVGTPPLQHHFPRRNRLIAGMSLGVIVVEAALRSGSLITARLANEYGREVFAVPGPIDSREQAGCHALIVQGARLITSAADVAQELPMLAPCVLEPSELVIPKKGKTPIETIKEKKPVEAMPVDCSDLPELATAIYACFRQKPKWHIDELVEQFNTSSGSLFPHLFLLREKGILQFSPGQWYERAS